MSPGSLFQFHKGTIRTPLRDPVRFLRSAFQFHKGTIRTSVTRASTRVPRISIP